MTTLETLHFDNTYARLPDAFYRQVDPTPLPAPYLISFNQNVAKLIGLDAEEALRPDFSEYFIGNKLLPGSNPLSAIYAGHQFGSFVPQLGDGRAILLGEVVASPGRRYDIQLKGAGPTPFSRMGDGRAVLRSTIREYLCSEAMHALGIPSTRALCITGSHFPVHREAVETAAVLTRVAETHVRFGTFELFYSRGQHTELRHLADYVITEFYPDAVNADNKYLEFFRGVVARTASLIAGWQAVGFAHGVMNTDNMSIIGLIMDYGPFGFLDEYDAGFVCNHSDYMGRYAFDQQPAVAWWNLARLGEALSPLFSLKEAEALLEEYQSIYFGTFLKLMRGKLGFTTTSDTDGRLIYDLVRVMQQTRTDYTNFFRELSSFKIEGDGLPLSGILGTEPFQSWTQAYRARLQSENSHDVERMSLLSKINPKYVLRNHIAQNVITAAENNDYTELNTLLAILIHPYDEHPGMERFASPPPPVEKRTAVSCSS